MSEHPMQPLEMDDDNIVRFKKNAIVTYLLDAGQFDMNDLAVIPFSAEDREQFAQLIGYSVSGFGDLSYARPQIVSLADQEAESFWAEDELSSGSCGRKE